MSHRKRKAMAPPKRRNPLHDHPLLRKSAVHGKTRKAERRAERVSRAREWPVHSAAYASAAQASAWSRVLRTGHFTQPVSARGHSGS